VTLLIGDRATSFCAQLKWSELQLLRSVVRRVYLAQFPAADMSDRECDRIIEAKGPVIAERLIRRAVDGRFESTGKLARFG
jgi:hypothetical protein